MTLLNLHGNGLPISIPEDEKMWSMMESSYQQLEFQYAPSQQQVGLAAAPFSPFEAEWLGFVYYRTFMNGF